MFGRIAVLVLLALTLTGCPGMLGRDNFDSWLYVRNTSSVAVYVRPYPNDAFVTLVPPGVVAVVSDGLSPADGSITVYDLDCHVLGRVPIPDLHAFLVTVDNKARLMVSDYQAAASSLPSVEAEPSEIVDKCWDASPS